MEPSIVAAAASRTQMSCGDLVGDARSGRHAHQPQSPLHQHIVQDFQEGRLFKLYRQPLAKRPVKDGVACRVRDISEDNRIFVRRDPEDVRVRRAGARALHSAAGADRVPVRGRTGEAHGCAGGPRRVGYARVVRVRLARPSPRSRDLLAAAESGLISVHGRLFCLFVSCQTCLAR